MPNPEGNWSIVIREECNSIWHRLQIQSQIHRISVLSADTDVRQRRVGAAVTEQLLDDREIYPRLIGVISKRYLVKYFTTSYISRCCT